MPIWRDNTIMLWNDNGSWVKITDHNRAPLSETIERLENKQRMVDGTLRRYVVGKKRSWSCSWANLPSTNSKVSGLTTADGGWAGEDMENFHNRTDGPFQIQFRRGDGTVVPAANEPPILVMISDYSKEVVKRGLVDLWNLDFTLEEV